MKRYKKIVVLLLVLAVCSIAAFAALNYEEKQEQIRNSDSRLFGNTRRLTFSRFESAGISWRLSV